MNYTTKYKTHIQNYKTIPNTIQTRRENTTTHAHTRKQKGTNIFSCKKINVQTNTKIQKTQHYKTHTDTKKNTQTIHTHVKNILQVKIQKKKHPKINRPTT